MPVRRISPDAVPVRPMCGRTLQWLVTRDTLGANNLSMAVMRCEPGAVVRPLHAHRATEELVYILEGQGEVWVEGEVAAVQAGDAVLFPPDAKHMTRNTGDTTLVALAIFSPPTTPESYVLYEEEQPW
ncbi:MAG: cupin domain-containing protein [Chloroflexi bacterium]|nr:cupin domain-containing protein [Chloroflexota bacterium]